MFHIVTTLLGTTVLTQKKVYEVTNTPESFGGLYVETDKPFNFRNFLVAPILMGIISSSTRKETRVHSGL